MNESNNVLQQSTSAAVVNPNCGECCAIFTNPAKRTAFGYQATSAACECHDICVQDVRDICVASRTLRACVPCNTDGSAGCRGGFLPEGVPQLQSWRVLCADESLSSETGCDRINNDVEFEIVLRYDTGTLVVLTPRDRFSCKWHHFARFPSGVFYKNNTAGLNAFRNELAQIDGSCKVIVIESVQVVPQGNNCVLEIVYKVIDKLWKHENLLVSALKPYVGTDETNNITISQKFEQGHLLGPCIGDDSCGANAD